MTVMVIGPTSVNAIANDLDVVFTIQYCSSIIPYTYAVN